MSSEAEVQSANILSPQIGSIAVIATAVAPATLDLASVPELADAFSHGRFVTFYADGGDIYVAMSNTAALVAIDPAAVAGNTRCYVVPINQERHWRFRNGFQFLNFRSGAGTPTLRMYISSFTGGGVI